MKTPSLQPLSRRRVLALLGLAIPAAACVAPDLPTPEGSRRKSDKAPDDGLDVASEWDTLAADLEGAGPIYSAANPGPWAGKEKGHTPTLKVTGTMVSVELPHEMKAKVGDEPEHYITTIYVRDAQREIVYLAKFKPTDTAAKVTFPLPAGATADTLTAYAHCNLHGLWSSRTVAGAPGAQAPDPAWATRAAQLEALGLYSATDEGPWPGKAPRHVPVIEAAKGVVQVTVPHEMRPASLPDAGAPGDGGDGGDAGGGLPAHYVATIYIKDQNGVVIGLKEFKPTDPHPVALFSLPPGTTSVTAFEWCNLHGTWKSNPTPTTT